MAVQEHPHDRLAGISEGAVRAVPPVIAPGHTFASVTDKISAIVLTRRTPRGWVLGFAASFALALLLLNTIAYLVLVGVGMLFANKRHLQALDEPLPHATSMSGVHLALPDPVSNTSPAEFMLVDPATP